MLAVIVCVVFPQNYDFMTPQLAHGSFNKTKTYTSGWWYTYPSEKWWSSSVGIIIPNFPTIFVNKTCSKPSTRTPYYSSSHFSNWTTQMFCGNSIAAVRKCLHQHVHQFHPVDPRSSCRCLASTSMDGMIRGMMVPFPAKIVRTYLGPEIAGTCNGNAMEMQWKCNGNAMEMQWKCNGNAMEMQWKCNGNAMDMPGIGFCWALSWLQTTSFSMDSWWQETQHVHAPFGMSWGMNKISSKEQQKKPDSSASSVAMYHPNIGQITTGGASSDTVCWLQHLSRKFAVMKSAQIGLSEEWGNP